EGGGGGEGSGEEGERGERAVPDVARRSGVSLRTIYATSRRETSCSPPRGSGSASNISSRTRRTPWHPGEGKTWLVGGGDYVTMKTRGNEVDGRCRAVEVSPTRALGPPLRTHEWAEHFYVLDGEFEFDRVVDGRLETRRWARSCPGTECIPSPSSPALARKGRGGGAAMNFAALGGLCLHGANQPPEPTRSPRARRARARATGRRDRGRSAAA